MKSNSKNTIERDTDGYSLIKGEDGKMHKTHIRIRRISCGKKCGGCPHAAYKYAVYRDGGKTKEKYMGKVKFVIRP